MQVGPTATYRSIAAIAGTRPRPRPSPDSARSVHTYWLEAEVTQFTAGLGGVGRAAGRRPGLLNGRGGAPGCVEARPEPTGEAKTCGLMGRCGRRAEARRGEARGGKARGEVAQGEDRVADGDSADGGGMSGSPSSVLIASRPPAARLAAADFTNVSYEC